MARSKQNKSNNQKDGKYRKETKEERKLRLKEQEEAREQCLKLLPMVGGAVLVLIIIFALYVRSVPPRAVTVSSDSAANLQQPQFQGNVPDFMTGDTEPMVKEALDEAAEVLNNLKKEGAEATASATASGATAQGVPSEDKETVETIEL